MGAGATGVLGEVRERGAVYYVCQR